MILHFAFHIIFLIIFPISPLSFAQDHGSIIAQPGCNSFCGDVDIPFPFGMEDPKCYADKWFEIECRAYSHDIPYLKSLNLEVYDIYAGLGMVQIMNPIYHSNCQNKSNNGKSVISLRGSPFIYSQEANTFLAVGCNNHAFLQSNGETVAFAGKKNGETVGGCVSLCDENNNFSFEIDGCHGRYCCDTTLPTHLSEYNATLQHLGEQSISVSSNSRHGENCSFALIVSEYWLSFRVSNPLDYDSNYLEKFNDLKNMDYAPAMLEWEILNDMLLINSTMQLPSDSDCYGSNVTSSTNRTNSGWRCQCSQPSYGNPYVAGGCTDGIIAQPGCNSTCGNVDIPFPFGMKDPKCYADKWFEIECRTTSNTSSQGVNHKPYLKSLNMEVTNIYEGLGMVSIMNPIYRSNCQNKSNNGKSVINLRGSPFIYSQTNRFLAVGCNNHAFMQSNGETVGGCVSLCDENNNFSFKIDGCHGRYCCETSLPTHLSEFNATLRHLGEQSSRVSSNSRHGENCSFALIVSEYWLSFRVSDPFDYDSNYLEKFNDLKNMDYAPVMLEWEILNSTVELPSESDHVDCYASNVTSLTNETPGRRCRCSYGYGSNPYVAGGCIGPAGGFFDYDKNNRRKKSAIVGVSSSLGSIILLVGLWLTYKVTRKKMLQRRKEKFFKRNGGLLLQQRMSSGEVNVDKTILFTLKDLKKATDNFNINRVLGKGGQGTVYKGMLLDGRIVAVKKFKVEGKVEEFINEFVILSQINNRNVVKLLGCCLETEIPLLVYEFIPNGNLYEYLHGQNEDLPMTWDMRLRIATEIAGALYYLHSIASQPIYHRDVKTTNIMLDEKYRAKLADFGASRIISIEATHLTTAVQGTFGYLDPEYFHTSQFTEKSDVYSFGVVLAELLTGHKPISSTGSGEYNNLASYFVHHVEENILFNTIDKRVTKEGAKEHIVAVANLAHRCLELNGRKRPTMKEVMLELEGIRRLDKKSNAQPNNEEIELAGIEEYPPWSEFPTSNSLPTRSN